jgi:drug/metabolite transporter (DMT)-like permease
MGFAGALVILGVWRGLGGSSLIGQLMCLGAAACYGVSIPYTRRFLSPRSQSGVAMSACQLIVSTLSLAIVAPLVSVASPHVAAVSGHVIAAVLTLGAIGTGMAFVINMRNIRLVGASTASMVAYLVPVFATVVGVLVLRERLEWFQPLGAVIVLAGVAVSQGLGRQPAEAADPRGNDHPRGSVPIATGAAARPQEEGQ